MLFRTNVDQTIGLHDLNRCYLLGQYFQTRGHKVAFAVNRSGVDQARAFLPKETTVYRIPDDLDEDAERLGHLGRTHKHKVAVIALRHFQSAYSFHVQRMFDFTAVIDYGSPFLIYTNLLINPTLNAHSFNYQCSPEARLLLGPKFHICSPTPIAAPTWEEPPTKVLVNLASSPSLLNEVTLALAGLAGGPALDILMPDEERTDELEALIASFPGAKGRVVVPGKHATFNYHDYPLIITETGELCMDLAHQGLCFVTAAIRKEQVADAYVLDQLGAAPTLGWHASRKAPELRKQLAGLLTDPERRARLSRAGRQLIDGQGVLRIARFIPEE